MEKNERKCPKCESTTSQRGHGTNKKGNPRYRCMMCKAVYSFDKPRYDEDFKNRAIQMYLEGNSGRAVARFFKFGKTTFWKWLREYEESLPKTAENDVEIAELDELYTHIKKGKQTVPDDNSC